jgi:uncharacterized protein YecT (DUF1311 family)
MQNISFFVIISVLLGCAFFFSQLTNRGQDESTVKVIPEKNQESADDIPECAADLPLDQAEACYVEAASVSKRLVDDAVDRILAMETNSDERIAFMDVQYNWEESRDSDCEFIFDRIEDPHEAKIKESICQRDQNLARLDQLEAYACDWFVEDGCKTPMP